MFKFELQDEVTTIADERGKVIGRAEYDDTADQFFVRYIDGTGCAVEKWFSASALTKV